MKTLPAITLCLLCLTAHAAENELRPTASVVDGGGGHRIDFDATGKPSLMADSLFTNCVLWLPFSYDDGVNAYDLSASGNDIAATNANTSPTWSSADGGAWTFDGVDDYAGKFAGLSEFRTAAGAIVAWVRPTFASGGKYVLGNADDDTGVSFFGCRVFITTGDIDILQRASGDTQSTIRSTAGTLSTGTWHNVAFVSDGSAYTLYINGLNAGKTVVSGADNGDWMADTPSTDNVIIGTLRRSDGPNGLFQGGIDDVRIYNRALTSNEQFTVYNNTKATYGL